MKIIKKYVIIFIELERKEVKIMTPYICENTIVRSRNGRVGIVIGVDHKNKLVVVQTGWSFWTVDMECLMIISYKGVG